MQIKTPTNTLEIGNRPLIMGILNVTPDSFSDGGSFVTNEALENQINQMVEAGVDIIDVGGESTRPFSEPVSVDEELERVIPAIEAIRKRHSLPISVDTTKSPVARQAIEVGADIINDISALRFDPEMINIAKQYNTPVVLMHMQGTPRNMQLEPAYDDVVLDIKNFFSERIDWAEKNGLSKDKIIIDPGIGFGKSVAHNLTILKHLDEFNNLGCPVLIGHSRKSFIGKILDLGISERDTATAAVSAICVANGAAIIRVHDVGKNIQAMRLAEAILNAQ